MQNAYCIWLQHFVSIQPRTSLEKCDMSWQSITVTVYWHSRSHASGGLCELLMAAAAWSTMSFIKNKHQM